MGRIAGESREDARVRRLFQTACAALEGLMTNLEVEPAVRLRAASVVFRALVNGVETGVARRGDQRRITWEEYVKGIRTLDTQEKTDGKPPTDGDTEH
jgi:hypothetical protein